MWLKNLINYLLADSALTTLVGNRIYAVLVEEGTSYPCIRYLLVSSSTPDLALGGAAIFYDRLQFDGIGLTYGDAVAIRDRLCALLGAWKQSFSDGTNVLGSYLLQQQDFFDDGARTFSAMAEYRVTRTTS